MTVLITVDELAAALHGDHPPVVLDVRWALGGPPGQQSYLAGHIPGAVYVDLDSELAGHGAATDGRHPLPTPQQLQSAARRWGLNPGSTVVAYDGSGNLSAARAWWLLRWAGLTGVRLLDGALPAWIAAGQPLDTDDVVPEYGSVTLRSGELPTATIDTVTEFTQNGLLVDARAGERFRGESEPVDPKAGHIPGARSAPTGENLAPDGRFRSPDEILARFSSLGFKPGQPVAVYCGSGVTAAHTVAALAIAGHEATLFPGSWSQWSNHDLPVAVGAAEATR